MVVKELLEKLKVLDERGMGNVMLFQRLLVDGIPTLTEPSELFVLDRYILLVPVEDAMRLTFYCNDKNGKTKEIYPKVNNEK